MNKLWCGMAVALLVSAAGFELRAATAFEQNRKLGRGVNIIGYDPLWRSRDQGRFQEKHFRLLHEAGFNSVRIVLQPFRHMDAGDTLPETWFATLNWAVSNALANKLVAIVDLHEFQALGEDPPKYRAKFLSFWKQVSARLRQAPPEVYFEILNEPNKGLTPELWNDYLRDALQIIRETNPRRTVVIGPASWNSIDQLDKLQLPGSDRNLIVTVHYYKPMEFTHQGASWVGLQDKTGVAWNGTAAELKQIEQDFDKAAAWAKQHDRPIFLGEFGAYDKGAMESRARYTAAVARAAEARGWSWGYWQFDSDFILYDIPRDAWVAPILKALIPAK